MWGARTRVCRCASVCWLLETSSSGKDGLGVAGVRVRGFPFKLEKKALADARLNIGLQCIRQPRPAPLKTFPAARTPGDRCSSDSSALPAAWDGHDVAAAGGRHAAWQSPRRPVFPLACLDHGFIIRNSSAEKPEELAVISRPAAPSSQASATSDLQINSLC